MSIPFDASSGGKKLNPLILILQKRYKLRCISMKSKIVIVQRILQSIFQLRWCWDLDSNIKDSDTNESQRFENYTEH